MRAARRAACRWTRTGTVTLEGVSFTTCPVTDVAWQMNSRSIVLDTRARNGTGRGTSVEFKGVPIIYLPWMTFPIGPQRKSGFFFPSIGGSSRSGAEVDAAVLLEHPAEHRLHGRADLLRQARRGLRRRVALPHARQRGTLDFNYLPSDDVEGIDRTHVHLEHLAELPGDWRFRIDATDVGDSNYFEDFAHGPEGTSVPFTERLAEASYRDEHWNVRAQVQDFQTIDEDLPAASTAPIRARRACSPPVTGTWALAPSTMDSTPRS